MSRVKEQLEKIEWDLHEQPQEEQKPKDFTEENNVELFGIEPEKAKEMVVGLSTTLAERQVLKDAYVDVIELEITTENLSTFKELRLKIMRNRTQGLTKWKEKEKSFYLAGGNFIQAIYNKEVAVNEEMEAKLLEAEKFFENQEKEKARLLNLERIEKVRPYVEDIIGLDFTPMTDEDFDDYVLGKKTRFENEKAEREAEALRIENARLAEIERKKAIEIENAKLKKEAEEKEALLQKERAETARIAKLEADKQAKIQADKDAEIKKEREAKEKLEAEIRAKRIEQENAEAKEKAEADKLAKAGVKVQLDSWVDTFNIEIPIHLKDNDIANDILSKFWQFKSWSKKQSE